MVWWNLIWFIASLVVGELLRPKLEVEDAAAAGADDTNFPKAVVTDPIPVVFGRVRLRHPNIVWWGDYFADPIRKKVGKGGFMGTGHTIFATVGYRYFFGMQMAFCHGPNVSLHKIWSEETLAWSVGSTGGRINIYKPNLYGGEEQGGGLEAFCDFYPGSQAQAQDVYLTHNLTEVPAYRGVSYLTWIGRNYPYGIGGRIYRNSGYIGTSPNPRPITVEVSRYPNNLGIGAAYKIGDDANPAEIIYEALLSDANGPDGWGMGLSASMIDTASFQAAGATLAAEGLGMSLDWAAASSIEDLIAQICKTIDAVCYRDFRTGKYKLNLIRQDYLIANLPVLDPSNILSFESYTQSALDGTTNEVKINYLDRAADYKQLSVQAQDLANMRQQDEVISTTQTHRGITSAALAERIAQRELLGLSTPLAKVDLICNREAYAYGPGDAFVLSWPELGITQMVMRLQRVSIGLPDAAQIRLTLVQDVFSMASTAYVNPGGSGWVTPITGPTKIITQKLVELPYYYNKGALAKYMVCARRPTNNETAFDVWQKLSSEGTYVYRDSSPGFCATGTLKAAWQSKGFDAVGFALENGNADLFGIEDATVAAIRDGANLAVFETGEIIAFTTVGVDGVGALTLSGIYGGLIDTVPASHALGERVWIYTWQAIIPDHAVLQNASINVKNPTSGPKGLLDVSAADVVSLTLAGRNLKPYPPGDLKINGYAYPLPDTTTGDAVAAWKHRNRLTQTQIVFQGDASDATAEGTYTLKLYVGGVLKSTTTGITAATATTTAAARAAADTDGTKTTVITVEQVSGAYASAPATTDPFTMTGFGMTFGLYFGGIQQ